MRKPLVVGNWKMNGSRDSIKELLKGIEAGLAEATETEVAVCPPFVFLDYVAYLLKDSDVQMGSQNICDQDSGAFTGEISNVMLNEIGCTYALVGHSERRSIYGEGDVQIPARFAAARRAGIKPVLCVGEQLTERESGNTEKVVGKQIDAVIALEGVAALADAVIAYEPVWAIGTGVTATPDQAQEVHAFIRAKIAALDASVAEDLSILYGGSMNPGNAAELLAKPDIDGGLIGGASLKAADFVAICTASA
ncbi:MAG: triose-phosphate isomerase [Gammaproteobacteria bacterium]|nr:triose-phosphate isomerase [Gammaproteobacteria bacterium]